MEKELNHLGIALFFNLKVNLLFLFLEIDTFQLLAIMVNGYDLEIRENIIYIVNSSM